MGVLVGLVVSLIVFAVGVVGLTQQLDVVGTSAIALVVLVGAAGLVETIRQVRRDRPLTEQSTEFHFVILDHEPSRWERVKWWIRMKRGWRPPSGDNGDV